MQPERSESKVVRNQSLNADIVLFTTPALVGKNGLTVEILFRELALIRFLAVEVLLVELQAHILVATSRLKHLRQGLVLQSQSRWKNLGGV